MDLPSGDATIVGMKSSCSFPDTLDTASFCAPSTYDTTSGRYLRGSLISFPFTSVSRSRGATISGGGGRRNGNVNGFSPRMNETYSCTHPLNVASVSGVLNVPSLLNIVDAVIRCFGVWRLSFHRKMLKKIMISWNELYIGVAVKNTRVIPLAICAIR